MKKAVFALANNPNHADRIVQRLQEANFDLDSISVIFSDKEGLLRENFSEERSFDESRLDEPPRSFEKTKNKRGSVGHEKHTKAPEGGAAGAAAGGIIGGSLGLLAGIGAIAIPGLGAFIAAGPIIAALSGSGIGGALGLLVGSLVGLGIPEYEAKKYENQLKQGNVLICVHVENSEDMDRAKNVLQKEGAKDISTTREKVSR